jgi:iron uptake system component EfeO
MHNSSRLLFTLALVWPLALSAIARDAGSLDAAAMGFKNYVIDCIDRSLSATKSMNAHIDAKDLPGAQQAWLAARGGWERSEIVSAEYFPELDQKIDSWPDAEKGFHAVEARLFGAHDVNVAPASNELIGNLQTFKSRVAAASFTPQGLLNGAARLAYEIGEDKSAGGESPFSGNSLAEIRDNLACIQAVFRQVFEAQLKARSPELEQRFSAHLDRLKSLTQVNSIQQLDQTALRAKSESLANDFLAMAAALGLQRPHLGN